MPCNPRQEPFASPATITVHDDGNVVWRLTHRIIVDKKSSKGQQKSQAPGTPRWKVWNAAI
jgi:hypothetical protein